MLMKKILRFTPNDKRKSKHRGTVPLCYLSPCVIYPVIDKTRTFFVSQRPFPLKLDYVKVNNLNFSASKIINLALAELILKKRS
jgi:hypothetical protein